MHFKGFVIFNASLDYSEYKWAGKIKKGWIKKTAVCIVLAINSLNELCKSGIGTNTHQKFVTFTLLGQKMCKYTTIHKFGVSKVYFLIN